MFITVQNNVTGLYMSIYTKSVKGTRDSNEDKHIIITNRKEKKADNPCIDLFGIFDGHGGDTVSTILSKIVPKMFYPKLSEPSMVSYPLSRSIINNTFNTMQKFLMDRYTKEIKECGSTCLLVFRYDVGGYDTLTIANVGDSRAIICSGQVAKQITTDHKPLDPVEKQRIIKQGGKIYNDGIEWRVGTLSLTRAFGDTATTYTKPVPDVFAHKITKNDKFLVMACDGLWDVIDNHGVVNYILHQCYDDKGKRIATTRNIAEDLARFAIKSGSGDNITIIVVFFDK